MTGPLLEPAALRELARSLVGIVLAAGAAILRIYADAAPRPNARPPAAR
jgi:hypothetical protein